MFFVNFRCKNLKNDLNFFFDRFGIILLKKLVFLALNFVVADIIVQNMIARSTTTRTSKVQPQLFHAKKNRRIKSRVHFNNEKSI